MDTEEKNQDYNYLAEGLYVNQKDKKISINNKVYNFSDILEAKLVENNYDRIANINSTFGKSKGKLTKIDKMKGKNRATGFSLGNTIEMINQLDLEIKINDMSNPFVSIPFVQTSFFKSGYKRKSKKYQEIYLNAKKCLSVLEMIINQK